jgi:hypothetical protein
MDGEGFTMSRIRSRARFVVGVLSSLLASLSIADTTIAHDDIA